MVLSERISISAVSNFRNILLPAHDIAVRKANKAPSIPFFSSGNPNPDKPVEAKWKSLFIGEPSRILDYFS